MDLDGTIICICTGRVSGGVGVGSSLFESNDGILLLLGELRPISSGK